FVGGGCPQSQQSELVFLRRGPRVIHTIHCPSNRSLLGPVADHRFRKQEVNYVQTGVGTGEPESQVMREKLMQQCGAGSPKSQKKNRSGRTGRLQSLPEAGVLKTKQD